MSTADRPAESASVASDVAAVCRDAEFVRLVASADGDALAATGVLARALAATDRPFQASVVAPTATAERATEADATVTLGRADAAADAAIPAGSDPVSEVAFRAAEELGSADAVLALAGSTVADATPNGRLREAAGVSRRPGVATPTTDLTEGLAYGTRLHAPFSGDPESVRAALADCNLMLAAEDATALDEDDRRRLASMVALRTVGADDANRRAAECVEDALRPHAGGPFGTVEGYGDVLDAVARDAPGTGVALALGHDAREAALDAWRTHGQRAHHALANATTGRYDGLFVARGESQGDAETPVGTAARLLRDFRSPEPVVLFVTDGQAAAAAVEDRQLGATMDAAVDQVGGRAAGSGRHARASVETDTASFIEAFREAL
ncbi:hypothetical protein BV210_02645 [Halorientalis sp. IM1011]|uniref:hypothetical protein n=1 Tax=Halorientalis sp. IM1011 TaxID=1932360 RepID=UPI00097CC5DD|nr:hypothetical protein [Halorientalis sp. IM1011]AQL41678.1 hypothetical protein BV210_02645 [Halorientalis sp. IM1011]